MSTAKIAAMTCFVELGRRRFTVSTRRENGRRRISIAEAKKITTYVLPIDDDMARRFSSGFVNRMVERHVLQEIKPIQEFTLE
ncbi:MAG: hypothetical protein K8U03_09145 [Planctomycetia bacterium]|nr:hypothetical protein [Planctomycetia bacterium]